MLRTAVRLAPSAVLPEVSAATVAAAQALSRTLGARNENHAAVELFASAVKKSPKLAEIAAVGTALSYIQCGSWAAALESLAPASASADSQVTKTALALRFKCLTAQLGEARTAAMVSGVANEASTSSLVTAAEECLAKMMDKCGQSYEVHLAAAEYYLAQPSGAAKAAELFAKAETLLQHTTGAAEEETASNAATVAFLSRGESSVIGKNGEAAQFKSALSSFEKEYKISKLTKDEQLAIAAAQASIEAEHHYLDFFTSPEYEPWNNTYTTPLASRLDSFVDPSEAFVMGASGLKARADTFKKPPSAFFGGDELLKKATASSDVLGALSAAGYNSPATPLAEGDDAYLETVGLVDKFIGVHQQTAESLTRLNKDALEQVQYRTVVGKAVALEQNNKPAESLAALDKVVAADRYIDMWKALLARGRVHRVLGNIDKGDADFKTIHALKKQSPGYDIPLIDENRYKSVF